MDKGQNAGLITGARLVAHVHLRSGVFTDKNDCQAGRTAVQRLKGQDFPAQFLPDSRGRGFAIDENHARTFMFF